MSHFKLPALPASARTLRETLLIVSTSNVLSVMRFQREARVRVSASAHITTSLSWLIDPKLVGESSAPQHKPDGGLNYSTIQPIVFLALNTYVHGHPDMCQERIDRLGTHYGEKMSY